MVSGDNSRLTISVTVAQKRVREVCEEVFVELRKDYAVPGFRDSSKVPLDMMVKAAGGESRVREAFVEAILSSTMPEVCQSS